MSNVEDNNTQTGVSEDEMQRVIKSAEQAAGLYRSFVKKMEGEEGQQIEDQSIEAFIAQQNATPEHITNPAVLFYTAARTNCMLMDALIDHMRNSGQPVSFAACNLFMQQLNQTVYNAINDAVNDSVH